MVVRILAATVAAFLISSLWYVAFSGLLARLSPAYAGGGKTSPWVPVLEIIRSAVLAVVVRAGCEWLGVDGAGPLVLAAVVAWIGFPVVLLSGARTWRPSCRAPPSSPTTESATATTG